MEALGRLWGGSWRPSWRILGPSWTVLEANLTVSRPTWEHLGANLGGFGANLAVLEATLHDFVDFTKPSKTIGFYWFFELRRVKLEALGDLVGLKLAV